MKRDIFTPRYNEGKCTTFKADYVIMAVGQTSDLKYIEDTGRYYDSKGSH